MIYQLLKTNKKEKQGSSREKRSFFTSFSKIVAKLDLKKNWLTRFAYLIAINFSSSSLPSFFSSFSFYSSTLFLDFARHADRGRGDPAVTQKSSANITFYGLLYEIVFILTWIGLGSSAGSDCTLWRTRSDAWRSLEWWGMCQNYLFEPFPQALSTMYLPLGCSQLYY